MSCCHNHSQTSLSPEPSPWKHHALLAGAALGLLLVALLLPEGPVRFGLLFVATGAGLWFPAQEAAGNLRRWQVDVDFLMLLVAVGAWLLGHPEEAVFLLVLFGASRAMEAWADSRTQDAVAALMQDLPEMARRVDDQGEETSIAVKDLSPGMRIALRPGERVPVDIRILEGSASIDTSSMTGESGWQEAHPGGEVPSGAVNMTGSILAEVLRPSGESAYQKIIHLVRSAPARRSPAQVLSDRVGRIYTAMILTATVVAFAVWWLLADLSFNDAAYRALVLLVAGSPCALVLSIPSAVMAGIATGARRGVLFHGGRGLLAVAGIRRIAFDKTGTLTTGEPSVIGTTNDASLQHLAIARALADRSNHPASRAVSAWLSTRRDLEEVELTDVTEVPGRGIQGIANGHRVLLGRSTGNGTATDQPATWLSIDDGPAVGFRLRETVRTGTHGVINALRQRGMELMILSGDSRGVVSALAGSLGIDRAEGELRPEQKHQFLREQSANGSIMMVGDGVNDAPALAAAEVGVAMGIRGSAGTIAKADLVLASDDLGSLVRAIDIGRRTRTVVGQNIAISVGAATILVATAIGGILPLSLGVLGHEGGTILVVLNSLRLLAVGRGSSTTIQGHGAGIEGRLPRERAFHV
jgi:Cd2+/Zn2+-exporting ATPase